MNRYLEEERERVQTWQGPAFSGRVTQVIGLLIESQGPDVTLGEICKIYDKKRRAVTCQVVGFKEQKVLLMALEDLALVAPGAEVFPTGKQSQIAVSSALLGRIVDAEGKPIDGKGPLFPSKTIPTFAAAPPPLTRPPIKEVLQTKVRAIDALCTLGWGQKVGLFSPPGVGKSTLMAMIAKNAASDINVIALVGERGREVRTFIEEQLKAEGLARSVVVVATSDQTALLRKNAAHVATAIAEYFCEAGKRVILMMDSITRYAMAMREIGLAVGEPPTTRGYTPSVFADLPKLLERVGNRERGSITGIYTILCEEEELGDPIPEQMRSLLDGHIHLSRTLSEAGHHPAIDVLKSLSRLMPALTTPLHQKKARDIRSYLHTYKEAEELLHIGAYVPGTHPKLDEAIKMQEKIQAFLRQEEGEGGDEPFPI